MKAGRQQQKDDPSPSPVAGRGRGGSSRPRSASTSPPVSPPSKRQRSAGAQRQKKKSEEKQSQPQQQPSEEPSSSSGSQSHHHQSRHSSSSTSTVLLPQHYQHPLDPPIATLLQLPIAIANAADIPDIERHLHRHQLTIPLTGTMLPPNEPSATPHASAGGASAPLDSTSSFHQATMHKQRAATIPRSPVVDIPAFEANPSDPKAFAIYTAIVSWVDHAPDLASLALVSKLVHVAAMKRLWSGMFFPSIGYFSHAPANTLPSLIAPRVRTSSPTPHPRSLRATCGANSQHSCLSRTDDGQGATYDESDMDLGAKGRPPPATTLDQDDTYATPDPTPFKFPDDRTLTFVSPSLGGLQYLNVSCCVDISAAGLQKVLHSVPELKQLALHFCQKIDIAAAVARRPDLRKLTHLTLNCKIRCGATITSFR
ncbi:hypothetical protein FRB90_010391 [Tulasnella sp. 427]|nr:hypothetical protein FRB90_010391 [Tulasnella sp. 427]